MYGSVRFLDESVISDIFYLCCRTNLVVDQLNHNHDSGRCWKDGESDWMDNDEESI